MELFREVAMVRSLSNHELASKLEPNQVDRVVLDEAARRLKKQVPLAAVDKVHVTERMKLNRESSARLSTLASRILRGEGYTDSDVRSLAASVLSQDDTPGQS